MFNSFSSNQRGVAILINTNFEDKIIIKMFKKKDDNAILTKDIVIEEKKT